MAAIDALWLQREAGANAVALSSMRSLMPVNINALSAQELCVKAKELGGVMTLELATEFKNNKLLQWIITDPKDIARANFLTGPSAACFEAIESLDIVEMRAIAACLPMRFELDGDGRKEEWRERFMGRVKLLVQQEQGEQVKGGWDGTTNRRAMITLQVMKNENKTQSVRCLSERVHHLTNIYTHTGTHTHTHNRSLLSQSRSAARSTTTRLMLNARRAKLST